MLIAPRLKRRFTKLACKHVPCKIYVIVNRLHALTLSLALMYQNVLVCSPPSCASLASLKYQYVFSNVCSLICTEAHCCCAWTGHVICQIFIEACIRCVIPETKLTPRGASWPGTLDSERVRNDTKALLFPFV